MSRIALALHTKTQLCQDIETVVGIQAFRGSQGTSSQDLAYLLDKRIVLYGKRESKTRDKSTNLVKSWYKQTKDQYDLICQQFKVERSNSPNPRSTSKTTKRTASLPPSSQSSQSSSSSASSSQSSQPSTPFRQTKAQIATLTFSPLQPRIIMSKQKKLTAERHCDFDFDADIERPEKHPGWTIKTSQQVIIANNQITKITFQASVADHRDFQGGKFQLVLSADGYTVYARSPSKITIYCMSPNITSWIRPVYPPSATKPYFPTRQTVQDCC
jgi:hypothetical protein